MTRFACYLLLLLLTACATSEPVKTSSSDPDLGRPAKGGAAPEQAEPRSKAAGPRTTPEVTEQQRKAQAAFQRALDADAANRFHEAGKLMGEAAELGNAEAQYTFALWNMWGRNVPFNEALAAKWLLAAAEQGHVDAQLVIAGFYQRGRMVKRDLEQSALWYMRAADAGVVFAHYLAGMSLRDIGLEQSKPERLEQAVGEFRRGAQLGDRNCAFALAKAYDKGEGVQADKEQAIKYYHITVNRPAQTPRELLEPPREVIDEAKRRLEELAR